MAEHIGSKVSIPGARGYGILQYYGGIQGKLGVFGGVELIGPIAATRGKNSGAVDGIQYFEVEQPLSGLFLPWDRLVAQNPQLSDSRRSSYGPTSPSTQSNRSSIGLRLSSGMKSPMNGFQAQPKRASVMERRLSGQLSPANSTNSTSPSNGHVSKFDNFENQSAYGSSANSAATSQYVNGQTIGSRVSDQIQQHENLSQSENYNQTRLSQSAKIISSKIREKSKNLFENDQSGSASGAVSGTTSTGVGLTRSTAHSSLNGLTNTLEKDLVDITQKYEQSQRDMAEKTAILDDLRATVNELQPLLEEYEGEIAEKEKKLVKQRADFEKAREEWRSSIDLMSQEQQENELFFESQINELTDKLELLRSEMAREQVAHEEEVARLNLQIDDVKMEEKKFEAQLEGRDIELRILRENLEHLQNAEAAPAPAASEKSLDEIDESVLYDKDFLEMKIGQLQRDLNFMQEESTSLKDIVEELEEKLVYKEAELGSILEKNLVHKVKQVSIEDTDYEKRIQELKHELDMRPTFDELVELQDSIEQLESLHKSDVASTEEELRRVINENRDLQNKLEKILAEQEEAQKNGVSQTPAPSPSKPARTGDSLPIYQPAETLDPSSGRNDWCGLCERDGHSSMDCPYENDIF